MIGQVNLHGGLIRWDYARRIQKVILLIVHFRKRSRERFLGLLYLSLIAVLFALVAISVQTDGDTYLFPMGVFATLVLATIALRNSSKDWNWVIRGRG